jgi:pimeloyl-ACP methyl ester carboxylesterase
MRTGRDHSLPVFFCLCVSGINFSPLWYKNSVMGRKSLFIQLLLVLFSPASEEVQDKLIGINLESYPYFAPVSFIDITVQKEPYVMAYMDLKPASANGETILLLHGKNFNGNYWRQTADTLVKKGYRVVIPDQIGFGKSSKPQHFQYSFQQLALNTKKLLDKLGVKTTVVMGHSMGGMLAARFALMYPATVSKLVLEDPIGLEDYKLKVPYPLLDSLYMKELRQNYASLKLYEMENYYDNTWKEEYEEWLKPQAELTTSKDYPVVAWNNALTTEMILTQPVVYELSNIKCPTLIIVGMKDHTAIGKDLVSEEVGNTMGNYPELGKKARKAIKGSTLVKLEDTGHVPHIQSFDKFIQPLVKFLGSDRKVLNG